MARSRGLYARGFRVCETLIAGLEALSVTLRSREEVFPVARHRFRWRSALWILLVYDAHETIELWDDPESGRCTAFERLRATRADQRNRSLLRLEGRRSRRHWDKPAFRLRDSGHCLQPRSLSVLRFDW